MYKCAAKLAHHCIPLCGSSIGGGCATVDKSHDWEGTTTRSNQNLRTPVTLPVRTHPYLLCTSIHCSLASPPSPKNVTSSPPQTKQSGLFCGSGLDILRTSVLVHQGLSILPEKQSIFQIIGPSLVLHPHPSPPLLPFRLPLLGQFNHSHFFAALFVSRFLLHISSNFKCGPAIV